MRDEAQYLKRIALQHDQQSGATSHMAIVAFDNHVAFCDEYVHELHETLKTLYTLGPTPGALEQANKLVRIRPNHAVWLTPDIEPQLKKFDAALRKIGALAHTERQYVTRPSSRSLLEEVDAVFADVLGISRDFGQE
jgi:hypothetical protein